MTQSKYAQLGVSADKREVGRTFGKVIRSDFPGTFVPVIRDPDHPGWVRMIHLDGDGSKAMLRVLLWRITGDSSWLAGMVDDGLSMNTGDGATTGFIQNYVFGDVINIGKHVNKKTITEALAQRFYEIIRLYRRHGIDCYFAGGETAELRFQVATTTFDIAVTATTREDKLVRGNVKPTDVIWGFRSDGRAVWEKERLSGIQSNGLTLAQLGLLSPKYHKQFSGLVVGDQSYYGPYMWHQHFARLGQWTIAEALTSPTRQWAILIKVLLNRLDLHGCRHLLHGISMNTGGGATKIRNVGRGGIRYVKRMPEPPAIFQIIHETTREKWGDMLEAFNCGFGLDVIGHRSLAPHIAAVAQKCRVGAAELGICERCQGPNQVVLKTPYGTFEY